MYEPACSRVAAAICDVVYFDIVAVRSGGHPVPIDEIRMHPDDWAILLCVRTRQGRPIWRPEHPAVHGAPVVLDSQVPPGQPIVVRRPRNEQR